MDQPIQDAPPEAQVTATTKAEIPPFPARVTVQEYHRKPMAELAQLALDYQLRINPDRTRHHVILDLMKLFASKGVVVTADGILEVNEESQAFLRWPEFSFKAFPEDPQLPSALLQKTQLRPGHLLTVKIRAPYGNERGLMVEEILAVEGMPAREFVEPKHFDNLTAMFPDERIILENPNRKSLTARAVDLITPLGRGQRALIVAPPRTGKTILLKEIAQAIRASSPESHVILLLIDERPEEVTDLRRSVDAEIFCSTFDEPITRHAQVAELVAERAKRLVEGKKHVVVLLDSITRLARGYNAGQPVKGRTMSGGVESKALMKPKKFFGSARNVEEGGSLTIIATALTETESRMDEVIFEEFKGTGNMELHLDRSIVENRIFPAIHIVNSGTRREELLYHPQELERVQILRRQLAELPAIEAMEVLHANLKATQSNAELLLAGLRDF
jgi:transcription termination factor Rho